MTEPFKFEELNEEELEITNKFYVSKVRKDYVKCNGFCLADYFRSKVQDIINMEIRDDDVWICSFPKAGTTWTQEMVWCIANDLNLDTAKIPLGDRFIFLDICFMVNIQNIDEKHPKYEELKGMVNTVEKANSYVGRRFIKTHLPYSLLPAKLRSGSTNAKIVCVIRNPKDCAISAFHHRKLFGGFGGDLEDYCDFFLKGLVNMGPYWNHVFSYWNQRNDANVFFVKFEDMKKDLPSVVRKVMGFMEKNFNDDEINLLCDHLSFENMKKNPSIKEPLTEIVRIINNVKGEGNFIRSGTVGQWKKDLSREMISRFTEWEEKNLNDANLSSFDDL